MNSIFKTILLFFPLVLAACNETFEGKLYLKEPLLWVQPDSKFEVIQASIYPAKLLLSEEKQVELYLFDKAPIVLNIDIDSINAGEIFTVDKFNDIYELVGSLNTVTLSKSNNTDYIVCTYTKEEQICGEHEMRDSCYLKTTYHFGWKKIVKTVTTTSDELMINIHHRGSTQLVGQLKLYPVGEALKNSTEKMGNCLPEEE